MVAGFAYAPVTKGILIQLSILTVLVSLFQLKPHIHLQLFPHVSVHHQYYRLLAQHSAFTNSSELFLCLLLFYTAGVKVERTFGSYKYAAFLTVTTAIYTVAQVVLLSLGSYICGVIFGSHDERDSQSWIALAKTPAGPFGPLFAVLVQYHCIIPHLWTVQIGRFTLTDQHITVHSLALVLVFSQPFSTLFCVVLAVTVSALYRSDTRSGLKEYRIPPRVYRIASLLLAPWVGSTRLPQRSWRAEQPIRSSRDAREARLAEHNATVASVNAHAAFRVTPRLASLLSSRARPTAEAALVAPNHNTQAQAQTHQSIVLQSQAAPPASVPATSSSAWNNLASPHLTPSEQPL